MRRVVLLRIGLGSVSSFMETMSVDAPVRLHLQIFPCTDPSTFHFLFGMISS
jgi:hypothetical protein